MTEREIARRRLCNQQLTRPEFRHPADVVRRLGAVQAQDYAGAKWGIGQRMLGAVDSAIERAFNEGAILRTHLLRPTWHFVTASDIRWMLALTAPRVNALNAFYYRKLELDAAVFRRTNATLTRALRDGKQLVRAELAQVLERAGIDAKGSMRLGYIMMRAELDGTVCSGARRGKQFTYALLEERVPPAGAIEREEALLELARRYFATRGPATTRDFAWWSGLTLADAKKGIEVAGRELERDIIGADAFWFTAARPPAASAANLAHLLPNYDEYFIGFRDRSAIGATLRASGVKPSKDALSAHILLLDGQIVGGWKRAVARQAVTVQLDPLIGLARAQRRSVMTVAESYAAFLELPVNIAWAGSSEPGKSSRSQE